MNVSLTPELDQFVVTKVASGRYTSASEVVREALRLLEERDQARSAQLGAFNEELSKRCQGRSKTKPVWRSKSRPVVGCEVVG